MRICATILGLLLLPSILIAQEAPRPPDAPRFLFFLPEGLVPEAQIRYFASMPRESYSGVLKWEPEENAYELSLPATQTKVIAYLPGCQLDTLELTAEAPTTQELDCGPLSSLLLSGRIDSSDALSGKTAIVEASYLALWAHEFFGIADGMIAAFKVASAVPNEDGAFELPWPDFADDPVATGWKMKGEWQLILREVGTGNILAFLKPTGSDGLRLEVRSSYPGGVAFTAVRN